MRPRPSAGAALILFGAFTAASAPVLGAVLCAAGGALCARSFALARRDAARRLRHTALLLARGDYDEAHAELDAIDDEHRAENVQRAVELQRALCSFRRGALEDSLWDLQAALERPAPRRPSEQAASERASARALRALVRAHLGQADLAGADVEGVRADVYACPEALGHAALSEVLVMAEQGERESLRLLLATHEALLAETLHPRERETVRALHRSFAGPSTTVYRLAIEQDLSNADDRRASVRGAPKPTPPRAAIHPDDLPPLRRAQRLLAMGALEDAETIAAELTGSADDDLAAAAWALLCEVAERSGDVDRMLVTSSHGVARLGARRPPSDTTFVQLRGLHAFALAARCQPHADSQQKAEEAIALLEQGDDPQLPRAVFRARLAMLVNLGRLGEAKAWVDDHAAELALSVREELLADLTRAAAVPEELGAGELGRLKSELTGSPRRWLDRVAPRLIEAFEEAVNGDDHDDARPERSSSS